MNYAHYSVSFTYHFCKRKQNGCVGSNMLGGGGGQEVNFMGVYVVCMIESFCN